MANGGVGEEIPEGEAMTANDSHPGHHKKRSKLNIIILAVVVLICILGFYGYIKYTEIYPSTDDAYINANTIYIAAQVDGKVKNVFIKNNQKVNKDQLLFTIDPEKYQYSLQKARADNQLSIKKANATEESIKLNQAKLKEAQAKQYVAMKKAERIMILVKKGAASKEQGDEVTGNLKVANADVEAAKVSIKQQRSELNVDEAQIEASKAGIKQAQLNLKYTKVFAPASGFITNFQIRPGSMINTGQNIFVLVANNNFWVDANYKETDIERIKVGQKATIEIDMYPGVDFTGVVESLSYGSGSVFSLLPPENATGNWVKVTQRFPVRVEFTSDPKGLPLRVGSTVTVTIDTNSK